MDYTLDDLKVFLSENREKSFRAEQIFDWIYRKQDFDPCTMSNLPKTLQDCLENDFKPFPMRVKDILISRDGSKKALFECSDRILTEAVALPSDDERTTYCLSTQVGCPLGCVFCATGAMGFKRNLTAGEIVAEVLLLEKETTRPTNLVLMGMGESLLNFNEVDKFIRIISEPKGYALSERRITLSTAGLIPELLRFHKIHPKVELAISVNASNNETRKRLMPHKKLASFTQIMDVVNDFDSNITLEYVLLGGINDSKDDAIRLAKAIKRRKSVKINLIRYNKSLTGFKIPKEDVVLEFQKILRTAGIRCFIRKSMGDDIKAACGQMTAGALK